MNRRQQLAVWLRRLGNDPRKVAYSHLFTRPDFSVDDHAFLEEHFDALIWADCARWLAYRPERPQHIVERIVESFPPNAAPPWLMFNPIADYARFYEPEVLDGLAEELRPPRVTVLSWWEIARHLKDVCPSYAATISDPHDSSLALVLFAHRRSERELPRVLTEAIRTASVELRTNLLMAAEHAGLLGLVRPATVLPEAIRFNENEIVAAEDQFLRVLALRWPGEDAGEARAWYLRQIVTGAIQGVAPWVLWQATPPELREAVVFQAQDQGHVLPWLVVCLRDALERREPDVWDRFFRYLDTPGALEPYDGPLRFHGDAEGGPRIEDDRWLDRPKEMADRMLLQSPLPEDPDEAFEERLVRHLHAARGLYPTSIFQRRASLPLTVPRANRLLREALASDELRSHTEMLARIAACADPLPASELPPVEDLVDESGPTAVTLYRRLGGSLAEERLRAWVRAPDIAVYRALTRAESVPDLLTDGIRRWLAERARELPIAGMLDLWERREQMPWLVDETSILAFALERAEVEEGKWFYGDPPKGPAFLLPAVWKRVRSGAPDEHELTGLLRWLEAQGEPLPALLDPFLAHLSRQAPGPAARMWVTSLLSSRSRWDRHGRDIVAALIRTGSLEAVCEIVELALPARDGGEAAEGKKRHRMVVIVQEAVARALASEAEDALRRGDDDNAVGLLHALTALHPPTSLSSAVHRLRYAPTRSHDVDELIELNEELLAHDTTREAIENDVAIAMALLRESRVVTRVEPSIVAAAESV